MANQHNHHRKQSSVVSIGAGVAGNSGKIERFQAFSQWRSVQADLYSDFFITGLIVHRGDSNREFILECTSPGRHWLSKKKLKQFVDFQTQLEKVFPVEAGTTGRPRILPKLSTLFTFNLHTQIDLFLNTLLTVSPLIARSRVFADFLLEDCLDEQADEAETLHGIHISHPIPQRKFLKCSTVEYFVKESFEVIE